MSAFLEDHLEMLLNGFVQAAQIANYEVSRDDLNLEFFPAPHKPEKLHKGKRAIYGFGVDDHWLKIGKAGGNSNARFQSQHYNPRSANSNLASSILKDGESPIVPTLSENTVGEWIKKNCYRFNVLFGAHHADELATFMEAFFIFCLKPRYEGRWQTK